MLRRYQERRGKALTRLGNKCAKCDVKEHLEFDHIIPSTKWKVIAKIWSYSEKRFWQEIDKCQLLCQVHHQEKTVNELGREFARGTHGTLSALRYCKPPCELCLKARSDYAKLYTELHKDERNAKRRAMRAARKEKSNDDSKT